MEIFNRSAARRKYIAALNLEPYVNRAVDDFGLKPEDIDAAMREYRHFLYLAYWNRRFEQVLPVVPTVGADKIWHAHILFTRDYRELCDRVFGRYLDHNPGLKEGTSDHSSAMQHTRDVHKRIRALGKEPGFEEGYFAFLDPKPAEPRRLVVAGSRRSDAPQKPAARTARHRDDRRRDSDDGGDFSPIFGGDSGHSDFGHHSSDHGFSGGGGSFGGGGSSGSWDSGSSSSSDSGSSGSSCGGGSGCGG